MSSRSSVAMIVAVLAVVALIACRSNSSTAAVAGAASTPVGPLGTVPGPGSSAPETPNPYANDPTAAVDGRKLFVRFNCSGCHGGRAGGGMGPSLRDPEWIYGSRDASIHDSIAQGRAHGMPAWGTKLPDDYVWKLTAYIKSLGTPSEPHPPQ